MENPYAKLAMAVGHENLFHRKLTLEEIIEIISKYPTILWLDIFAKIEGFLLIPPEKKFDAQSYLAEKLFPPSTLTRTGKKSEEKEYYFSLAQLNIGRKLAIKHGLDTGNMTPPSKVEISKILLGIQDTSNEYDQHHIISNDLKGFCKFCIRNGYLNNNMSTSFGTLFSRAYRMYVTPKEQIFFKDGMILSDLLKKEIGLTLEQAMALNFALTVPFCQANGTFWETTLIINPKTFFSNNAIEEVEVDSIIDNLVINYAEAKRKIIYELEDVSFSTSPVGYNLEVFRKTPFIRFPTGQIACVSLFSLFEKSTQNVIWMSLKNLTTKEDRDTAVNKLTDYRGRLFEAHLKEVCRIFESKNNKISFFYISPESTADHEEVGDSILIQGNEIVIFEAKSRQFNESFKYTGDWENDSHFMDDLIKGSSEQIQQAAKKILDGKIKNFPIEPKDIKRIHPVVVTYDPVPMFGKVQKLIREKIKEYGYLNADIFAPFEIVKMEDLEDVMDSADTHTLIDLLKEKNLSNNLDASEADFHNFLAYFINTHETISNGWQSEQSDIFFKKSLEPNLKFISRDSLSI